MQQLETMTKQIDKKTLKFISKTYDCFITRVQNNIPKYKSKKYIFYKYNKEGRSKSGEFILRTFNIDLSNSKGDIEDIDINLWVSVYNTDYEDNDDEGEGDPDICCYWIEVKLNFDFGNTRCKKFLDNDDLETKYRGDYYFLTNINKYLTDIKPNIMKFILENPSEDECMICNSGSAIKNGLCDTCIPEYNYNECECSICMDNNLETVCCKIKSCNHIFHHTCLNKLIEHNKEIHGDVPPNEVPKTKCPLCRAEFDIKNIHIISIWDEGNLGSP